MHIVSVSLRLVLKTVRHPASSFKSHISCFHIPCKNIENILAIGVGWRLKICSYIIVSK